MGKLQNRALKLACYDANTFIQELSQKVLAFLCGTHARLGADSLIIRYLDADTLRMLLDDVYTHPEWMDEDGKILP